MLRLSQLEDLTGIKRHTLTARVKATLSNIERSSGNHILLSPEQVKTLLHDRLADCKGKIIYTGNLKGGVGKTSIVYLLATALSNMGYKCCLIDLDTQSNLTSQYIKPSAALPAFHDLIDGKIPVEQSIVKINDYIDLIPSSFKNSLIQKTLTVQAPKHHIKWFNELCLNYLREHYDIIFVDTPPHLTTLNSVFTLCLTQSDSILIPICADEFSIDGVKLFIDDITEIREVYGVEKTMPSLTIVINKFSKTEKSSLEMLVKISEAFNPILSGNIIEDLAKINEIVNKKINLFEAKGVKPILKILSKLLEDIGMLKA